jgi:hypothetical protein
VTRRGKEENGAGFLKTHCGSCFSVRCRPERRARASPHAAAAELGLTIFSPRTTRYGCLRFSSAVLSCPQFRIAVVGSVVRIRESVDEFIASNFD